MVWIKERVTDDGDKRFVACYRDPEGRQRSAGTYSSRRAAVRAANRRKHASATAPGTTPRAVRSPSPTTSRAFAAVEAPGDLHPRGVPVLPRQALPAGLRASADGQDPPVR